MSWLDRFRNPLTLAQREAAIERARLEAVTLRQRREASERAYDAAQSSRHRPMRGDQRSGNAVMDHARYSLRSWARHLDENHDLAVGVLDDLVKKIIGCGIAIEPMIKAPNGRLAVKANDALRGLWLEWAQSMPESSRTLSWPSIEALACRTWLRDGEFLIQHLESGAPIRHRSRVPYSIELIEADYLPFDWSRASTPTQNRIVHGVELTDWREPIAYWLYREHPGDLGLLASPTSLLQVQSELKRVSADLITHVKFVRRFGQVRGVSVFHSVLQRLEDIKEYEESERVAARVAAAFCAVIKRNGDYSATSASDGSRIMEMNPGMIFDNLLPGEDVQTIGTDRPNSSLENFRNSQIRAIASGTGTSYSGVSRNYNGTYSAQRQELVESWVGYELMREYLYGVFYRPIWQRFVRMAIAAGQVPMQGVDTLSIFGVDFVGPSMPWIDPVKEVDAAASAVAAGFKSRHMVIRENQYDPQIVDEQIKADPLRDLLAPKAAATATPKAPPKADANADPQPDAAEAA